MTEKTRKLRFIDENRTTGKATENHRLCSE